MAFDNKHIGHDSVDNPENYSPYAWERAVRNSQESDKEEPKKAETRYNPYNQAMLENGRQIYERAQKEKQDENMKLAIKYKLEEKKQAYQKQSLFIRAMAKLQGKDFDRLKSQLYNQVVEEVAHMSNKEIQNYIEDFEKKAGKAK